MDDILLVAGARPNFMKVAPLVAQLRLLGAPGFRLVHTGQHYDAALSEEIMKDLGLPAPDHHLGVGSAPASLQIASILERLEPLVEAGPRAVVVVGDVTSSLAAALSAAGRDVPVVHIEAGLRSRDWTMPEERNRVLIDRLSQLLFVTEPAGVENLAKEGIVAGVHLVGNLMIDSLLRILPEARKSDVRSRLGLSGRYAVLTLHRPGNTDDLERFHAAIDAIADLAREAPVVFPVHPRTRAALRAIELPPGFLCISPLGYRDFVSLVAGSALVLTDSGGLQEETTVLRVPCLTLRPNTERPITVAEGTNELVDLDAGLIRGLGRKALAGEWKETSVPDLWDGRAAARAVRVLAAELQ